MKGRVGSSIECTSEGIEYDATNSGKRQEDMSKGEEQRESMVRIIVKRKKKQ